jgi:hypothetical protein
LPDKDWAGGLFQSRMNKKAALLLLTSRWNSLRAGAAPPLPRNERRNTTFVFGTDCRTPGFERRVVHPRRIFHAI